MDIIDILSSGVTGAGGGGVMNYLLTARRAGAEEQKRKHMAEKISLLEAEAKRQAARTTKVESDIATYQVANQAALQRLEETTIRLEKTIDKLIDKIDQMNKK